MPSPATPQHGYQVAPHELTAQLATLSELGDQTNGLVASANRLADHLPKLGTAPPAMHLAMRLREAAGQSGLAGEVGAANTELNDFHRTLKTTLDNYLEREAHIAHTFRTMGGATT